DCAGACASAAGPAAIDIWAIAAAPRVQAASRVRSFIPLCSFVSGPRGRQGRTTATSSLAPEGAAQERDHRKHDEDEEQYLGNRGRPGCDPAEAEHGGDQGDDEENDGVVQHGMLLSCLVGLRVVAKERIDFALRFFARLAV